MMDNRLSPVEPLSERGWASIERGVFAQLGQPVAYSPGLSRRGPPRRIVAATLVGVFCSATAVATWFWLAPQSEPGLPTRVVTQSSSTQVAIGESTLDVAPHSMLVVTGNDQQGVVIVLERGKARFEVSPRRGRPPFVVLAGSVHVKVVGTRFEVMRQADSATVRVLAGQVRVTAEDQTALLRAGDTWPSTTSKEHAGAPEPEPAPEPAPTPTPAAATPEITEDKPDARAASTRPASRSHRKRRKRRRARDEAFASLELASAQQRYEQAALLEARDPNRAGEIYRELSKGRSKIARLSLFARARLESDRGHSQRAKRLLTDYVARYPRGENVADAHTLLERLE